MGIKIKEQLENDPAVEACDAGRFTSVYLSQARGCPPCDGRELETLARGRKARMSLRQMGINAGRKNGELQILMPEQKGCEKVRQLVREVMEGEAARQAVIEGNLFFVVKIARAYNRETEGDRIQAGNIGLIRAADDWQINSMIDWPTHASARINSAIQDLFWRRWGLSRRDHALFNKIRKTKTKLEEELGRKPQEMEVVIELFGGEIKSWSRVKWERYRELYYLSGEEVFLEEVIEEAWPFMENENLLEEAEGVESDGWGRIDDWMERAGLLRRQREVIDLLYGRSGDGRELTMEDLAKVLGKKRQTVSEIVQRSFQRLGQKRPEWVDNLLNV